jgi:regulator of RNase E activity RraA
VRKTGLAGELFTRGALVRGLAGLIVDGGYRDIGYVSTCDMPVYSRFVTPVAGTATQLGEIQVPVSCGGVVVHPGDIIMADHEGIIVVEPEHALALLQAGAKVKELEAKLIARIVTGSTLSTGLNLEEHVACLSKGEPSSLRFID